MAVSSMNPRNKEWTQQAYLGNLPDDFLRVSPSTNQLQEAADAQTAHKLQKQYAGMVRGSLSNAVGRLDVTAVQAKLVKNYGLGRMDPYVRLRVGHTVYETPTCVNGARNPVWDRVVRCYIPAGIVKIHVEVFDERSLTLDERIAWTDVEIPDKVMKEGETHDEWYPLSGKQGLGQEGHIQLVLSYSATQPPPVPTVAPMVFAPGMPGQMFMTHRRAAISPPPMPELTQDLLDELKDMFPAIEEGVIRSVYEANRGNKEETVTALLEMS